LALAVGCGGSAPPAKRADSTPSKPAEKPAPPEVQASPNIAISMDIAEACNIAAEKRINPRFEYNEDELLDDDRSVLDTIAKCLADGPLKGRMVNLIGRTDPRGTEEYNLGLGSRRSSAVREYMNKLGTKPSQLLETTRGSLEATGTNEAGWSRDRRVDIVLVAAKSA
jgi:peptidoglycan-associated lipoprotein